MLPPTNPYGQIDPEKDFIGIAQLGRQIGLDSIRASQFVDEHRIPTVNVAGRRVLWRYVWEAHVEKLRAEGKLDEQGHLKRREVAR